MLFWCLNISCTSASIRTSEWSSSVASASFANLRAASRADLGQAPPAASATANNGSHSVLSPILQLTGDVHHRLLDDVHDRVDPGPEAVAETMEERRIGPEYELGDRLPWHPPTHRDDDRPVLDGVRLSPDPCDCSHGVVAERCRGQVAILGTAT